MEWLDSLKLKQAGLMVTVTATSTIEPTPELDRELLQLAAEAEANIQLQSWTSLDDSFELLSEATDRIISKKISISRAKAVVARDLPPSESRFKTRSRDSLSTEFGPVHQKEIDDKRERVLSTSRPIVLSTSRPIVSSTSRPIVLSTSRPIVSSTSCPIISSTTNGDIRGCR